MEALSLTIEPMVSGQGGYSHLGFAMRLGLILMGVLGLFFAYFSVYLTAVYLRSVISLSYLATRSTKYFSFLRVLL